MPARNTLVSLAAAVLVALAPAGGAAAQTVDTPVAGPIALAGAAVDPPARAAAQRRKPASAPRRTARPPRCPASSLAVTVGRRRSCGRFSDLRLGGRPAGAAAARRRVADAFAAPAAIRPLFGRRWTKGMERLSRVGRSAARDAAAGVPAASASATKSTTVEPPAGHVGEGATSEGDGRQGASRAAATMGQRAFVRECPLPGGELPGDGAASMSLTISHPMPGPGRRTAHVTVAGRLNGKLRGHVGDDARLRHYDLDATIEMTSHGRVLGPAGLEHRGTGPKRSLAIEVALRGIVPGTPIAKRHFDALTVRDPGPRDVEVRDHVAFAKGALDQAMSMLALFRGSADRAFERAERSYHDGASCLSATFDPSALSLQRGEPRQVAVTVADREGRRVALALAASASGGSVAPPSDTTDGTEAAAFSLTPDDGARSVTLAVQGTSDRGRVFGALTAPVETTAVALYAVSLTGRGSYRSDHGTIDSYDHHADVTMERFTTSWQAVPLPVDGGPVLESQFRGSAHEMIGTARSTGEDVRQGEDGAYDCTAPLREAVSPGDHLLDVAATGGGALALTLEGFHGLSVAPGTWSPCSRSGTLANITPSPTGSGANDFDGRTVARVTVTPAQLQRDEFTVPLTGEPLPERCLTVSSPFYCTHSLQWSATATFVRYGSCTRAGSRYFCTLDRLPPFS